MADDLSDPPSLSLYDADFLAWTEQQEAALRARLGGNALDWDNLAEEVGDMGRSGFRGCESAVENIIENLLKIQVIGTPEDLRGWRREVRTWRRDLRKRLTSTTRNRLLPLLPELHLSAAKTVREDYGLRAAPALIYRWDEIMDEDWWPEPGGNRGA